MKHEERVCEGEDVTKFAPRKRVRAGGGGAALRSKQYQLSSTLR